MAFRARKLFGNIKKRAPGQGYLLTERVKRDFISSNLQFSAVEDHFVVFKVKCSWVPQFQ